MSAETKQDWKLFQEDKPSGVLEKMLDIFLLAESKI